jgi:glutaconate CoA-transferase subunit B
VTEPREAVDARLAWLGAGVLAEGETVFVGIGIPSLSAMLAKRRHAPRICMIYESGVIDADPEEPPLSTGSPSVAKGAAMIGSMLDVFAMLQRGEIDVGLLSAAQVDRHGNLNSTVIGAYDAPKVRLPGSGGAHDIAVLARRLVILMPHDPRRLVAKVDFVTSPGFLEGRGARAELGIPGSGPALLITDRAIFDFEGEEMRLAAVHEGYTAELATAGLSWSPPRAPEVEVVPACPPDAQRELSRLMGT